MSRPWMPFYVADYLADTGHLSTLEHGAYLLLIMHYWQNGGLPSDDVKLARIARVTMKDWQRIVPTLADLFGDGWWHKRIEAEFQRAKEKSAAARESAGKRWGADGMRTHSEGNANGHAKRMLSQSQSPEIDNINLNNPAREFKPFPPDGSIAYSSPYVEIARKHAKGADPDMFASAFRKYCHGEGIPFDDPLIERKFNTFCGKHKVQGLHS